MLSQIVMTCVYQNIIIQASYTLKLDLYIVFACFNQKFEAAWGSVYRAELTCRLDSSCCIMVRQQRPTARCPLKVVHKASYS